MTIQNRPDVKTVLRSEIVQQHLLQLASVSTFQQPKMLLERQSVCDHAPRREAPVPTVIQPQQIPYKWVSSVDIKRLQTPSPSMGGAPPQPQQDAVRQIFFENQVLY